MILKPALCRVYPSNQQSGIYQRKGIRKSLITQIVIYFHIFLFFLQNLTIFLNIKSTLPLMFKDYALLTLQLIPCFKQKHSAPSRDLQGNGFDCFNIRSFEVRESY